MVPVLICSSVTNIRHFLHFTETLHMTNITFNSFVLPNELIVTHPTSKLTRKLGQTFIAFCLLTGQILPPSFFQISRFLLPRTQFCITWPHKPCRKKAVRISLDLTTLYQQRMTLIVECETTGSGAEMSGKILTPSPHPSEMSRI